MLKIEQLNQYYSESHTLWDIDLELEEATAGFGLGRGEDVRELREVCGHVVPTGQLVEACVPRGVGLDGERAEEDAPFAVADPHDQGALVVLPERVGHGTRPALERELRSEEARHRQHAHEEGQTSKPSTGPSFTSISSTAC